MNAGRAVARDVDVAFVRWSDMTALGEVVGEQTIAAALLPGEARSTVVSMPVAAAGFDDRSVAIELIADYYDDAGVRNDRLAVVLDDSLVHLPPEVERAV